jgi:hypothetical protein
MASAPVFIYSGPIVSTFSPYADQEEPFNDAEELLPTTGGLTDLIVKHTPFSCRLLPILTFLFNPDKINVAVGVEEFEPARALTLPPGTVVNYMDVSYRPTAWCLRGGRAVPYEFIRSDLLNHEAARAGTHTGLWQGIQEATAAGELELIDHYSLRLFDAMWQGSLRQEGAFREFDREVVREYQEEVSESEVRTVVNQAWLPYAIWNWLTEFCWTMVRGLRN